MTTLAALRRAMAASGEGRDAISGDWDFAANGVRSDDALTPAAVLIAVTDEAEPQLLLTRRTAHLRRHAGQVAFPGGRIDPGDAGPIAAALREADEEVALCPADVEVLGSLPVWETGTGYAITPVVGVIPPGLVLTPHEAEVADVFMVPFDHVMAAANHELREAEWQGRTRHYYTIRHGDNEIWGATAGIIVNLARRLG